MKDLQAVVILIGSCWATFALIFAVLFAKKIIRLNKDNWVTVYLGILLGLMAFDKVFDTLAPVVSADLDKLAQVVIVSSSSIIVGVIPLIALATIELFYNEYKNRQHRHHYRSLLKNRFEL